MKRKTSKRLEENQGEYLFDLKIGKNFLNNEQKVQIMKETIVKLSSIKIKNFWLSKDDRKYYEKQATIWENKFAKHNWQRTEKMYVLWYICIYI